MITETTAVDFPMIENIPEELAERPQWVCWRYEERDDKKTKVPYTSDTYTPIQKASTTDLMTWGSFENAFRALDNEARHYDGIGFVFSSADPFVGIDLDKCRDPESGELAPWAREMISRVPEGYIEVSPSGTGVHIIIRGSVRGGGVRKGPVEMYSRGRYFTITGHAL
jgi:primase-polymerase (primpol)-like protein